MDGQGSKLDLIKLQASAGCVYQRLWQTCDNINFSCSELSMEFAGRDRANRIGQLAVRVCQIPGRIKPLKQKKIKCAAKILRERNSKGITRQASFFRNDPCTPSHKQHVVQVP